MKRAEVAIALMLVLFFSLFAGSAVVKEVRANPGGMFRMAWRDIIVIQSPQNRTYTASTVRLNFTVEHLPETSKYLTRYVLEKIDSPRQAPNIVNATLKKTDVVHEYQYATAPIAMHIAHLSKLEDGTYKLTVQRYHENSREPEGITVRTSAAVIFTVVASQTYAATHIPEFPSWTIAPLFLSGCFVVVALRKKLNSKT